jgi:hypothetical protein
MGKRERGKEGKGESQKLEVERWGIQGYHLTSHLNLLNF